MSHLDIRFREGKNRKWGEGVGMAGGTSHIDTSDIKNMVKYQLRKIEKRKAGRGMGICDSHHHIPMSSECDNS